MQTQHVFMCKFSGLHFYIVKVSCKQRSNYLGDDNRQNLVKWDCLCFLLELISSNYMRRFASQLAQRRCDNVDTTSLLTWWHGEKWELTLPQHCCNFATTLSIGFLGHFTTDYSGFFPFIETWKSYKSAKWY